MANAPPAPCSAPPPAPCSVATFSATAAVIAAAEPSTALRKGRAPSATALFMSIDGTDASRTPALWPWPDQLPLAPPPPEEPPPDSPPPLDPPGAEEPPPRDPGPRPEGALRRELPVEPLAPERPLPPALVRLAPPLLPAPPEDEDLLREPPEP